MKDHATQPVAAISTLAELASITDYSFVNSLTANPNSSETGEDHDPRQVFSGHYVPVKPTPIPEPEYIAHSPGLFSELSFADSLATSDAFMRLFTGDLSQLPEGFRKTGWATGYALSIYGTEYTQQCPFRTGNGYGDGRAMSVLEVRVNGQRWEMQLKGGGRTPYCRGGDGRAVLRSSVREFLAQEHMHALGVPTSRSLCLYVSQTETVRRPWYSEDAESVDPDLLMAEPVAISTRVAPSFIRVGQLELFGRRVRTNAHPQAMAELEQIVLHLIEREYAAEIDPALSLSDKLLALASAFRERLTDLIAHWIRVGYCQGNFNSDNCAAGGYTLDYGPFGFCDAFSQSYQPWTAGGQHFAFMNQPKAAEKNYGSFCTAIKPLLTDDEAGMQALEAIQAGFAEVMQHKMQRMWASKLGLSQFNAELVKNLQMLMMLTPVDYTRFFRELSHLPQDISALKTAFYNEGEYAEQAVHPQYNLSKEELESRWAHWFKQWQVCLMQDCEAENEADLAQVAAQMKAVNPKYTLREWLLAPAYQAAWQGDYAEVRELQRVMTQPYAEQSQAVADKYYISKPVEFFDKGGVSRMSCSS